MFKKKVTVPVAVPVLLILLVVAFLVKWAGDSITWQRSLSKNTFFTMGGLAMEIPEGVDVLEYVRANGADFRNSIHTCLDCCFLCGHLCAGNYKQAIRNP